MTKQDKARVVVALGEMAVCLGQMPDAKRQELYLKYLSELSLEAILRAITKTIETWKFNSFPPVGFIRDLAGVNESPKEQLEDQAALAWERLRNGKTGRAYDKAALDDPIIYKCFLALGGRKEGLAGFGMWDLDQEPWKKKEFVSLYQTYARTIGGALSALSVVESANILGRLTKERIVNHVG